VDIPVTTRMSICFFFFREVPRRWCYPLIMLEKVDWDRWFFFYLFNFYFFREIKSCFEIKSWFSKVFRMFFKWKKGWEIDFRIPVQTLIFQQLEVTRNWCKRWSIICFNKQLIIHLQENNWSRWYRLKLKKKKGSWT
jgi:hypothetical protein